MSINARTLFTSLMLAACCVVLAPAARAQGNPPNVNPTHYWTYHMQPPVFNPQQVALQDQFSAAPIPNATDQMLYLVNWVQKTDPTTGITSPVLNPNLHYTWWNLQNKFPVNQFVQVTNQFGSYPVDVLNAEFLLAPALKYYPPGAGDPNAPPPVANHYLCYRANGFPGPTHPYLIQDEWRQDQQLPGPLQFLCVPCLKVHNGAVYPPVETDTHLALYPIQPQSPTFPPFIIDQFIRGQQIVMQLPVEFLMVPSTKTLITTDTKSSSWGRLKMLYR